MDAAHHALTHTLTARISPQMRADLAAAAEREDISTGEFARRALQLGLSDSDARSMSPREPLPVAKRQTILMYAMAHCGEPEARSAFLTRIIEEIIEFQDCAEALMTAVAVDDPEANPDALAGYLRQCDLHMQRAAAGINGLRARRLLDVIEAETRSEAA